MCVRARCHARGDQQELARDAAWLLRTCTSQDWRVLVAQHDAGVLARLRPPQAFLSATFDSFDPFTGKQVQEEDQEGAIFKSLSRANI